MNQNTKKPHKHAREMHAFADGEQIQGRPSDRVQWIDQVNPGWYPDWEYRIKPAEPERVYPVTNLSDDDLEEFVAPGRSCLADMREAINSELKRLCDTGQIVTREEFDRAVGDREVRDMAVARAVRKAGINALGPCAPINQAAFPLERLNLAAIIAEVK